VTLVVLQQHCLELDTQQKSRDILSTSTSVCGTNRQLTMTFPQLAL